MSPTLQDAVPIGTLEARVMMVTPPTASESKSSDVISRAYKLQGFDNAADKIMGAATRLDEEANKEERYWDQILSIKQKGWSISKVPRDPRTLGIHFGFRDAAPAFRRRGFAALRRNADGSLRLDQGAVPPKPVVVHVTVVREGLSCGTSSPPYSPISDEAAIDQQILQARNTLYEEELFHELGREGRLLANQGATMSSMRINIPMDGQTHLQIELVDLKNEPSTDISGPDQQLAEGIAIALRILLSHTHQQNLRQRSQPPPPMTLKSRIVPEYPLIRPILTHLQHRSHLRSLNTLLERLTLIFCNAGVPFTLESSSTSPALDPQALLDNGKPSLTTTTPTHLLSTLTKPLTTTTTITLPTRLTLHIKTHVNLQPPIFGTEYSFSPPTITYPSTTITLPRLSSHADLEKLLCHILTLDLVALIASTPVSPSPPSLPEGKLILGSWIPHSAHPGTLSLNQHQHQHHHEQQQQKKKKKLHVKVWPNRLGVRVLPGSNPSGNGIGSGYGYGYVWEADGKLEIVTAAGKQRVEAEMEGEEKKKKKRKGLLDIIAERL